MVSAQALTVDDLERLGNDALGVEDPLAIATELVAAVEQHRLDDRADEGFALLLAAEINERAGNLEAALELSGRGVEAEREHGDGRAAYPEAFHAELLLRLGREGVAGGARTAREFARSRGGPANSTSMCR
ncbi:hypothetical protein Rwratislav_48714 [Rhodococcus wratislaviensis IFP 2016]|nr:hypothetical protein Rwratislav_48714 [Rhodococcus wratislaviensis IFP 2016]